MSAPTISTMASRVYIRLLPVSPETEVTLLSRRQEWK